MNLSKAAVLDADFAHYVLHQIDRSKVPGQRLCFEIAAGVLADHDAELRRLMDNLRVLGCRFAVDGLECTHSALNALRKFKFDFFKIDGFTILNMALDNAELAKVKASTITCRKLGIETIAQFVESAEIRQKVIALGIDYAQGFGVARPDSLTGIL